MSLVLDGLIFAVGWTHVLLAPYTKVEESFNLHGVHDALMYGVGPANLHKYDHVIFPGAVPRTFIGSVALAWIATPVIRLAAWAGYLNTKFDLQIIVRLVLATLNALALSLIRRGATRRFGRPTGLFFALLTCSQFHYPFWMGRTIPNMYATIPVNLATYLLINRAPNAVKTPHRSLVSVVFLLVLAAVVLRAEVAALLAPLCIQMLYRRQISFGELLKVGLISSIASVSLTVLVDSYFWNAFPLWPEFSAIYFNVLEGKSAEWGVSPPSTYFISYLPKLLLGSLPLSIIGIFIDNRLRTLLLPALAFVALMSMLGHKEWRFIVYVVPACNIAAARVTSVMVSRRKGTLVGRLLFLAVPAIIAANMLVTVLSTKASMDNYPGGEALSVFHQIYPANTTYPPPHVHISNLAAQSGASLFLQLNAPPQYYLQHPILKTDDVHNSWIYNKTENLSASSLSSRTSPFTHLISEFSPDADSSLEKKWRTVKVIKGFDRWVLDKDLLKPAKVLSEKWDVDLVKRFAGLLRVEESDKLWILERKA
ncbi:hypothetical protein D9613_007414 [Agrocybe pediades]|uniref:Mannosyltransferase n=1 Tax=Agrocybe pediades TaxID=84607 RepID=A0A8H4VL98_9AGAR|nr:hypothetical protein D9613_007414 [Agrocybe pediades]